MVFYNAALFKYKTMEEGVLKSIISKKDCNEGSVKDGNIKDRPQY